MSGRHSLSKPEKTIPMGVFVVFWLLIVSASYLWSTYNEQNYVYKLAQQRSEMVFEIVVATRTWNAQHGGTYVPATKKSPPNPYLKIKEKNIKTPSGKALTLINPAYMTRQISEIMASRSLNIRLTSLLPLNPANEPDEWEKEALQAFERGENNWIEKLESNGVERFNYMAPLYTEKGCLSCHAKQGYQVGDIRGGLRVSFPYDDVIAEQPFYKRPILIIHVTAFLIFNLLTLTFLQRINTLIFSLKQERASRDRIIEEKTKALEELATTDVLTGIHNRRALELYLDTVIPKAERYQEPFSYILLDLDFFKSINDNYGHDTGDYVLKNIAMIIKDHIRRVDFLARYGGEEFIIIMPNTNKNEAYSVTERIRKTVESTPLNVGKLQISTTLSFGVTDYASCKQKSREEIFKDADSALYKAKKEGRNRGIVYEIEDEG